ncbi:MAG TPA: hypothetical protein VMZ22_03500 [Acidimicrobiales bacterium]|nr:hypothetical protein [Acidimicrobiales bacterium]
MHKRGIAMTSVSLGALLLGALPAQAASSTPQIIDPYGDANGLSTVVPYSNVQEPALSHAAEDVTSVLWQVVKDEENKVTGFTIRARLSAAPRAGTSKPFGASVVYRMLGTSACGAKFGVIYNTDHASSPNEPQSAVIDTGGCSHGVVVDTTKAAVSNQRPEWFLDTAIALPKIVGSTITWTVPLTAIPKRLHIVAGTKITDLRFSVNRVTNLANTGFETFLPVWDDGRTKTAFSLT